MRDLPADRKDCLVIAREEDGADGGAVAAEVGGGVALERVQRVHTHRHVAPAARDEETVV